MCTIRSTASQSREARRRGTRRAPRAPAQAPRPRRSPPAAGPPEATATLQPAASAAPSSRVRPTALGPDQRAPIGARESRAGNGSPCEIQDEPMARRRARVQQLGERHRSLDRRPARARRLLGRLAHHALQAPRRAPRVARKPACARSSRASGERPRARSPSRRSTTDARRAPPRRQRDRRIPTRRDASSRRIPGSTSTSSPRARHADDAADASRPLPSISTTRSPRRAGGRARARPPAPTSRQIAPAAGSALDEEARARHRHAPLVLAAPASSNPAARPQARHEAPPRARAGIPDRIRRPPGPPARQEPARIREAAPPAAGSRRPDRKRSPARLGRLRRRAPRARRRGGGAQFSRATKTASASVSNPTAARAPSAAAARARIPEPVPTSSTRERPSSTSSSRASEREARRLVAAGPERARRRAAAARSGPSGAAGETESPGSIHSRRPTGNGRDAARKTSRGSPSGNVGRSAA